MLFWDWMAPRAVEKGFGMILVGLDEPHTSLASPNVWELVSGGPCEVEGPSSCLRSCIVVVVCGVCSKVAWSVQRVSLCENHCIVSWSRDWFGFREVDIVCAGGGCRGGNGGVGTLSYFEIVFSVLTGFSMNFTLRKQAVGIYLGIYEDTHQSKGNMSTEVFDCVKIETDIVHNLQLSQNNGTWTYLRKKHARFRCAVNHKSL
jgi:hypothetical protein